jgi:hypothetical protein
MKDQAEDRNHDQQREKPMKRPENEERPNPPMEHDALQARPYLHR